MKLSTRGRYGTRLMLELAKHYGKGPVNITEISKKQGISVKYLEQIIIPLKKASLITSVRGPKGGHTLSKSPDQIFLWQILKPLESHLTLVDCVSGDDNCEHIETCLIRPVWGKAYRAMMNIFKETSLQDILQSPPNDADGFDRGSEKGLEDAC
jgi:Rrf2 family protein